MTNLGLQARDQLHREVKHPTPVGAILPPGSMESGSSMEHSHSEDSAAQFGSTASLASTMSGVSTSTNATGTWVVGPLVCYSVRLREATIESAPTRRARNVGEHPPFNVNGWRGQAWTLFGESYCGPFPALLLLCGHPRA